MKTFKCQATVTLQINIDVDAKDKKAAQLEAENTLKSIVETLPKHTDDVETEIVSLEEK